jgi:tetratricopeptide (TPR) repeat protein
MIFFVLFSMVGMAQINTQRLIDIGKNALYFEDYVVAIQYFNQIIKAKPHLTDPYLYRAYAKLNLEDYRGAIEDCNKALDINPFLPKVYYCRGYAYRRIGEWEKSTNDLKKSLEFEPNNINTTNLWIENLIRMEQNAQALAVCDSLLTEYPRYTEGYILRSQIYLVQNDTLQAIANLDSAVQYNKNADLAYAMRGMIKYEIGQAEKGLQDLDKAIGINAYRSDYYGNRAIVRMQTNNLRGAMSDFDTAISIDNKNALSYYNRGLLRANVGDDNRAIDDFSTCLALDPNNYNAYMQRAILNTQVGDYKAAIADYNTILAQYPDFIPAYYGRGNAKRKMRDIVGANKDEHLAMQIEQEIRSGKRAPKTAQQKALEPSEQGKAIIHKLQEEQTNQYASDIRGQVQDKNVTIEPLSNFIIGTPNPDVQIKRQSLFNAQLDHYNQLTGSNLEFCTVQKSNRASDYNTYFTTIEQCSETLQTDPTHQRTLMLRGYCLTQVEDFSSALADFDTLIKYYPGNVLAYFNRANARIKEAESSKDGLTQAICMLALNDLYMALQLDPNLIYAVYNMGYIHLLQQKYADAIGRFTQCIEQYPDFAEAYYNRGLIYLYQGDKEQGRKDLSKAGELGLHEAYNIIKRYAY